MGYSTDFTGALKFKGDITVTQLAMVKSFLGNDCRDHPEWGATNMTYIDLELLDDFSGVKWDGSEKTHGMCDGVNLITEHMRKECPGFGFEGELYAQGESIEDRWVLVIDEAGQASRRELTVVGVVECPDCGHKWTP